MEIILRMIERILGVLLGGLSITLGFYLFKLIPTQIDSEGKLTFPGGSIHLMRTGPGVFFALFGCLIIFWSFSHPITVDGGRYSESVVESEPTDNHAVFYGLSESDKNNIQLWILNLNKINREADFKDIDKENAHITLLEVKLFLMKKGLIDQSELKEFEEFSSEIKMNPNKNFEGKSKKWAEIFNRL
jgi:hypothetical protein